MALISPAIGNTLTIPASANTGTFSVPTVGDAIWEPDETIPGRDLHLTPTGTIVDYRGTGTIRNDDAKPRITLTGGDVTEGDAGVVNAVFEATLSNPWSCPSGSTIKHSRAPRLAARPRRSAPTMSTPRAGRDGRQAPALTIQILVPIRGDRTHENGESFQLVLSNVHNADPPLAVATTNILDNDPKPTVSVANGATVEGNADHAFNVVASLTNPSIDDVTFKFMTANGSATVPNDFGQAVGGSVTIPADATSGLVPLTIHADLQHEQTEVFSVVIYNAQNAFLGDSVADVTIADDDP